MDIKHINKGIKNKIFIFLKIILFNKERKPIEATGPNIIEWDVNPVKWPLPKTGKFNKYQKKESIPTISHIKNTHLRLFFLKSLKPEFEINGPSVIKINIHPNHLKVESKYSGIVLKIKLKAVVIISITEKGLIFFTLKFIERYAKMTKSNV